MTAQKILDRIEEMELNGSITLLTKEVSQPLTQINLEMIETGFEIQIPNDLKELLFIANGARIEWKYNDNLMNDFNTIKIHWLNLDTILMGTLGGEWEGILWDEDTDETELSYKQSLLPVFVNDLQKRDFICAIKSENTIDVSNLVHHYDYSLSESLHLSLKAHLASILNDLNQGFY